MRLVLVLFSFALGVPTSAAANAHWNVVSSDDVELVVELNVEPPQLKDVRVGDQTYQRLEMPGWAQTNQPGLPNLPRGSRWIAVPPAGDATLSFEVLARTSLGTAKLVPAASPRVQSNPDPRAPRLTEVTQEGEDYARFTTTHRPAVHLGEAGITRRHHLRPIVVQPVEYDAASGQLTVSTHIRIRVRFNAAKSSTPIAPGDPSSRVMKSVLNPELAEVWRAESTDHRTKRSKWQDVQPAAKRRVGVSAFDPATLLSDEVRVRVDATELFRIRMSDLIDDLNFPSTTIRRDVRLYQKRPSDPLSADYPLPLTADVPVAFVGNPDPDAVVSPDDILVFYGFHPRDDLTARLVDGETFPAAMPRRMDNWNSENVLWLAAVDRQGGDDWARMPLTTPTASTGAPNPSFRWREHFEADGGYQDNPIDTDEQRFHINDPFVPEVTTAVELRHPVAGSTVDLEWSTGTYALSNPIGTTRLIDYTLERDANVTLLETIAISSPAYHRPQTRTASVPADDFGTGFSTFRMARQGAGTMSAMLGSVTVEYDAEPRANFDQAFVKTGQAGGDIDLEVTGFGRDDLLMFDLTDKRNPGQVTPIVVGDGGGGFNVELRVAQDPGVEHEFAILPINRISLVRSADMEADSTPLLVDPSGSFGALGNSQVVAIGPEMFRTPMESWLQWRRDRDTHGWTYSFVDVQEIYDQFSGGVKSPAAIKAALEYAYVMWNATAALLVGDANENARGLGVTPGIDHVPTPLHVSSVLSDYELLASDKWFGMFSTDDNFPRSLTQGPDVLVGRLPAGDEAELTAVLNKIFQYESPDVDDTWRRRSLWVSDDAYSTDYFTQTQGCYQYIGREDLFESSQQFLADNVNGCLDDGVEGQTWHLDDFTAGYRDDCSDAICNCETFVRNEVASEARPNLVSTINQGWLIVSYQGHASYQRLGHETMFDRSQIPLLTNNGEYFLFFGMGCHVTDFLQAREGGLNPGESNAWGPPVGEMILERPGVGAIATYGSSGFEFLGPNKDFMERIGLNFFCRSRSTSTVLPGPLVGQWILGEQLAQSELDIIGNGSQSYREMMAQYNLLGDPLLRMDASPPRVDVTADGNSISDGEPLLPVVGTSTVALALGLTDESGVDRVEITDDRGRDYSSLIQYVAPDDDPRERDATVDLPIHAQGYTLTIDTYDGSYPSERPTSISLEVPFELTVEVDGNLVAEGDGPVGPGSTIAIQFTSPVVLAEAQIQFELGGGALRSVTTQQVDGDGRQWRLDAEVATVVPESSQEVQLTLAGALTEFSFTDTTGPPTPDMAVVSHFPFPNPTPGDVRFVVDATGSVTWGRVSVYDVAGRRLHFSETDGLVQDADGDVVLAWDGRDNQGDELANGVYFYRIELGGDDGSVKSDMVAWC